MKTVLFLLKAWLLSAGLLAATASMAAFDTTAGDEVTDTKTGLVWRRCSEGQTWSGTSCTGAALTFTHEQALQRATAQASSTGKAWRLPNVKELSSISNKALQSPAIDSVAFPATPDNYYWTSSPYVDYPDSAWVVEFFSGGSGRGTRSSSGFVSVRLVR